MAKKSGAHNYMRVLEPFSSEEMALIGQLKRFFEWVQGDPDFREDVANGTFSPERQNRLRRIGVTFDPNELGLLWKNPKVFGKDLLSHVNGCGCELPDSTIEAIREYPLLDLWLRFNSRKATIYRELRRTIFRVPRNAGFDAWRLRRIAAVRSELGFFGLYIDHPILAFELGDGCSIGCWFCAFAARKLTKNFDYLENREFFRRIAQSCVELFGMNQASMALLYYGTEPHDNPHYIDFLKDYAEVTGYPSCTSTAVVNDADWLRQLIAYYREGNYPWPRLSVLSKSMLLKIHDLYSPEELRDVELLMQMKDHFRPKVTGGRILKEVEGLRGLEDQYADGFVPQGSIACVSGFLINMVNQTIQLVSPCYTSQRWRYGYRIFDEATFSDADDFPQVVEQMIERSMPNAPPPGMTARFRDDLVYRPTDQGFDLVSPNQVHHFYGKDVYGLTGSLIAQGGLSYSSIYDMAIDQYGVNPLVIVAVVKKLFDDGFLDELNPTRSDACAKCEAHGPGAKESCLS